TMNEAPQLRGFYAVATDSVLAASVPGSAAICWAFPFERHFALACEFGLCHGFLALGFRNFGQLGTANEQTHFDGLTYVVVLATLGVQLQEVIAELRLGGQSVWARR